MGVSIWTIPVFVGLREHQKDNHHFAGGGVQILQRTSHPNMAYKLSNSSRDERHTARAQTEELVLPQSEIENVYLLTGTSWAKWIPAEPL